MTLLLVQGRDRVLEALAVEDPLGAGWFIRVRLDDPSAAEALLDQAAYEKLTA